MLGQTIIYLGTRHQIGYRAGFTTAKPLKSGQYQKILKISIGPRSPIFSGIGHLVLVEGPVRVSASRKSNWSFCH